MVRDMSLSEELALARCDPAGVAQLEIICAHQKDAFCILQGHENGISLHIVTPLGSYSLYCQRYNKRYFKKLDTAVRFVAKLGLDSYKMVGINAYCE